MTKKELAKTFNDLIDNFECYDYKRNAYKELLDIEMKTNKQYPHIAFILEQYPEFNNVCIKISKPDHFILSLCVNPNDFKGISPKKRKKAIKGLVKLFYPYVKEKNNE